MEKYEEYDKTYNDDQLNDMINNYNATLEVVENDEILIKNLEEKSNRTEQEEEELKKQEKTYKETNKIWKHGMKIRQLLNKFYLIDKMLKRGHLI